MNYQVTEQGVKRIDGSTIAFIPKDPQNNDWKAYQVWLAAGNKPTPTPPPDAPAVIALCVANLQKYMDRKAQEYGYDSIGTAVTYAEEPAVPKFQREGQAFRAWRSLVWAKAYAYLGQVQAGAAPLPDPNTVEVLVPPLEL